MKVITEKLPKNSAVLIMNWQDKIHRKGIRLDEELFRKLFPKNKPFVQQGSLETPTERQNIFARMFQALGRSAFRTLMHIEKIGLYDPKFDFKGYKRYLIRKEVK